MSAVAERLYPKPAFSLVSWLGRACAFRIAEKMALSLYCGFLFFFGINTGCFYRTEALRAIVAREFLRSGNWIVPTLYGEPLLTKPPGHYAAIAFASLPGGQVTEWSARLPSAVAACVTVLIFYCWFARTLGGRAGFIAALILPASLMWFEGVPSAEIDMVQLAWVVASLYCFYRAVEFGEDGNADNPALRFWWIAALVCVAGGVLTKWTAPIFFYGTVLPFLWWRGRLRWLLATPHLIALGVGVLIVGVWVGAVVSIVGGEKLLETVSQEALPKFLPGQRDRGYALHEIILLPARLLAANLPWSLFALATLSPRVSRNWSSPARRLLLFFHCWLWPNLLFWALVPNHAPRHSFPLAPAVAGLAALVWIAILSRQLQWPIPILLAAPTLALVLGCLLVAKVVFEIVVVPSRTQLRKPRETGEFLAQLVPADTTLHLFTVKDEGIMFYYDRPVQRYRDPTHLPSGDELLYCIITEAEWWQWHDATSGETLRELTDEQGARLLLVRMRFEPSHYQTTVRNQGATAARTPAW
jgi:4-amino-4-deoxy-L-arabinose transferase-like glycosyltransferase